MQFPQRDLTNQFISTSYQDVVQRFLTGSTDYLLDGMGFVIAGLPVASIGGTLLTQDQTASMAVSASYARLSDIAQVADVALMADTASISVESISSSYSLMADTASFIDVNNISNLYLPFQFTYKSQTSVSDPGAGNFNYDSFTSSSITRVVADILTLNGLNIKTLFSKVNQGYQLYIQQQSDATKAALFTVTGNISDNGGWLTVPVSLDAWGTGGYPTNNKSCLFAFLNSTTLATGSTYPITASWAVSASWAPSTGGTSTSASWASQSLSSSVSTTASFALTAGSVLSTSSSYLSGSSGSLNILNLFPPATSSTVIKVNALVNSTSSYSIGNGTWINFPVPYVRGNSNTPIAFDVMPGGGGQNTASIDISDTDVVSNNAVNYETLHLKKNPAGNAIIATHANGTGTVRPLVLQDASGSIGFNTSPSEQYHAKFDQNARTTLAVENANTGSVANVSVEVRNKSTNTDYLRIVNTGTGFTANGAFGNDGGALELGPTKSGSLSILTRTTASAIVMYQGGFAVGNEKFRIAAPSGRVSVGGITNPVNAFDVAGNISCSVVTASLFFGTASMALTSSNIISTTSASWASQSLSSSNSTTASYALNGGGGAILQVDTIATDYTVSSVNDNHLIQCVTNLNITLPNIGNPSTIYVSLIGNVTVGFLTGSGMTISGQTSITGDGTFVTCVQTNSTTWEIFGTSATPKTLYSNLIAFWPMDQVAPANIVDIYGLHGMTPTVNTSSVGTGLTRRISILFSGSQNYISNTINDADAKFNFGDTDFSISSWVYPMSSSTNFTRMFSRYDTVNNKRSYTLAFDPSISKFEFAINNTGLAPNTAIVTSDTFGTASYNTWYSVIGYHDSVNNIIGISVNGIATTASWSSGSFSATGVANNIGGLNGTGSSYAKMQDIGVWGKVLSPSERFLLYNGGQGLTYPFVI